MVIPVDADIYEAEYVGKKDRIDLLKGLEFGRVGDMQVEHHDRDQDCYDSITESLEAILVHQSKVPAGRLYHMEFRGFLICRAPESPQSVLAGLALELGSFCPSLRWRTLARMWAARFDHASEPAAIVSSTCILR